MSDTPDLPLGYRPGSGVSRLAAALAVVGGLTILMGLVVTPARTWANVLLVSYGLLGLGLGGVLLVAFQYTTGAGWGVAIRRLPEALAALIPVGSVGVLLVLFIYPGLYPWAGTTAEAAEPAEAFRRFWLNRPFFLLRALAYVALWIVFARALARASLQQDEDGQFRHTETARRLSAAFLVVLGLTSWLASVDWIMSLEPKWASTIFGVYHFIGIFQGGLAAVTVLAIGLGMGGALRGILTRDHLHDLGRLLFSFSSFWMYIWFSQFMLIWYVNNPEETAYFVRRTQGAWWSLFYLNVLINWVVPFLVLMPRAAKRSPGVLLTVALVVLVGRWLDLYLMILPALGGDPFPSLGIVEAGLAAGAIGVSLLVVLGALGRRPLVPMGDPFLMESLPSPPGGQHHQPTDRLGEELIATR